MKNKKKIIILSSAAAAVLIIVGCVVLAYLTHEDEVVNVFTVGDIKIALYEENYPGNTDPKVTNILPYTEIKKDPKIENTGSNTAYVFLKVTVPVETVTEVSVDGKKGERKPQEIFYLKNDTAPQTELENSFHTDNWIELDAEESGKDYKAGTSRTYIFGYKNALLSGESTDVLFDKVQLKNIIENEILNDNDLHVDIHAFGIQAEHLEEDFPKNELTAEQLNKIYKYLE